MLKTVDSLKQELLFEMDYVNNIGQKIFAYPFIGRSKTAFFFYRTTYFLVVLTAIQLFATLCLTKFKDWFEIINIAPNFGVCLMIVIKYSKIYSHRSVYDKILRHFRYDLWDVVSDSKDHRAILQQYTKTTRLIVRFQYYYTLILIVIVDLFPRIIMLYEAEFLGNEDQYLYPFDAWYPFDKVKWYYPAYIWESFMTAVVIFVYVFANMIHISYTRHICMELKILGNSMENLITAEDIVTITKNKDVDKLHENIKSKLKVIIKRHQYLAEITSELDDLLGDAMLLTYIFGSVFICLTAFTATVVGDIYMTVRYVSFFLSLLVEVFVQCIIGQILIDHSEKFERAIYSADWPHSELKTKKMLLILLTRAQKPFVYSANGYLVMNLDTFCGICSLSYQFFNLLRTAYN
uniref:Odorant receptor n=1 Tax=Manduca sexta TaxID=7130 RepID=A0A0P1J1U6_MANSE|nr:Olfactory receptor 17 [Manduca sexta]